MTGQCKHECICRKCGATVEDDQVLVSRAGYLTLRHQVEQLREFIRLYGKHLPHEVWLDAIDLLEEK